MNYKKVLINNVKNMFGKSYAIVWLLCTISHSSLINGSPVANEVGMDSRNIKGSDDDFIADSVIPNEGWSSGEARIFGNFSFGNSSILTVAGFVIVGIILFGKFYIF